MKQARMPAGTKNALSRLVPPDRGENRTQGRRSGASRMRAVRGGDIVQGRPRAAFAAAPRQGRQLGRTFPAACATAPPKTVQRHRPPAGISLRDSVADFAGHASFPTRLPLLSLPLQMRLPPADAEHHRKGDADKHLRIQADSARRSDVVSWRLCHDFTESNHSQHQSIVGGFRHPTWAPESLPRTPTCLAYAV